MSEAIKFRVKRDAAGKVIPRCWITDTGYTVAECRLPESRYTITRPGGSLPFAYTGEKDDVRKLISADIQASQGLPVEPAA
ncbi:hypothetical protein ACIGCM_03705 [Pseudomonas sp. NPDC078700]|uniref:hypothetical protein n=1 Tax=Pseudomonas sp. NPDC078700 TaxID=3364424 RepID=UPI0037CBDD16